MMGESPFDMPTGWDFVFIDDCSCGYVGLEVFSVDEEHEHSGAIACDSGHHLGKFVIGFL